MRIHLIDGTYELFRQHFGRTGAARRSGQESVVAPGPFDATIGVLRSTLALIEQGATHVAVASDHVIESFRNDLWAGYKTSEGMLPELVQQIEPMEEALCAMGVTVWPMVEWEADDALASAARLAAADPRVTQVIICTPDKDLGQCVTGDRVVQFDRRKGETLDAAAVVVKFGVSPASIPDWLALVGDSADGFPGLPGWGAKTAAAVLARYQHLEGIPRLGERWDVAVRGAAKLANTLHDQMESALLFRHLATLVTDVPVGRVDDWCWTGPADHFAETCERLGTESLARQVAEVAEVARRRAADVG